MLKRLYVLTLLASFILFLHACGDGDTSRGLDTSFGTNGIVTTAVGAGHDRAYAIAIQADGKIIAAGTSFSTNFDIAVVRYHTNGILDSTFSSDGKVTMNIGASDDIAYALSIQPDGKYVVAGSVRNSSADTDFVLIRYNTDGSLDTSFGSSGTVTKDFGSAKQDEARAILLQNDGKIYVAGTAHNGSSLDIAVARYTADGALDTGFHSDGTLMTELNTGRNDEGRAIVQQSTGKLVVAGFTVNTNGVSDVALVRYLSNGTLDSSFDTDGKKITSISAGNDEARAMLRRSNDRLMVVGLMNKGATSDLLVLEYLANGSLDNGFSSDGIATVSIHTSMNTQDFSNSVSLQADGKLIVAGSYQSGSSFDFVTGRFQFSGNLDIGFDRDGFFTTDFQKGQDEATATVVQNDGKIISAGFSHNGSNHDFALIRYHP